ncbi:MAG TPA: hypothetical protein VKR32_09090 [Puia sp.]|nr:hypothetical protein [Puia sp.]
MLIALMVFINAIKLLHSHSTTPEHYRFDQVQFSSARADIKTDHVKLNDRCRICEFQLIRDADLTEIGFVPTLFFQFAALRSAELPTLLAAFHNTTCGRSPPALG